MADLRTCPIDGCEKQHKRNMLMCRDHWYMVPKPLRDALWSAYRTEGVFSDEYMEARQACIGAVEQKEAEAGD